MKIYQFSKIAARSFPTIADLNNPWIFQSDVALVVNVSQNYSAIVADIIESKGITYLHIPLDEEVEDVGWDNLVRIVKTLLEYDREGKRMIVHCDFGQHRSRLVIEAFHYAKFGEHFIDHYKGYDNHLIYDCKSGHLPPLDGVEYILRKLNETQEDSNQ